MTLDDYLHEFQFEKKLPPSLAHRLDRDTSGCLILGRSKQALRTLGRLFEQGRINKTYWAIVEGSLPQKTMRIDMPLEKINSQSNRWHMKVDPSGQVAITELRVLQEKDGLSWLELKPKTGRTHQLRVHCAALGCPIVGDKLYGNGTDTSPLMLHARGLRIPYIQNDPAIFVDAEPSGAMQDLLTKHGFSA